MDPLAAYLIAAGLLGIAATVIGFIFVFMRRG